uniref:Uncharacterized protein n=1 Tax=Micrurus corallinus TaxID=54390 RepID=A0A2D4H0A4_MICCO
MAERGELPTPAKYLCCQGLLHRKVGPHQEADASAFPSAQRAPAPPSPATTPARARELTLKLTPSTSPRAARAGLGRDATQPAPSPLTNSGHKRAQRQLSPAHMVHSSRGPQAHLPRSASFPVLPPAALTLHSSSASSC